MSEYTELKRMAEAVKKSYADLCERGGDDLAEAWNSAELAYDDAANPDVVLGLIAELERSQRMLLAACMETGAISNALGADMNADGDELLGMVVELKAERDQLKADNEHARMRIKELDLLFGRYLLGMRSSVIEWQNGRGADAAMQWIWNGLAGPGELPPQNETQAQAYFDREIVAVDAGLEEVAAFFDSRRAVKQVSQ